MVWVAAQVNGAKYIPHIMPHHIQLKSDANHKK